MNELPMHIQKAAARYKSIECDGLTLYPVLVREYDAFLMARPAIEVMHQSLPVALLRVPLLSALYQMDYEAALSGQPMTGLFSRALLALTLSLRLGEGMEQDKRVGLFSIIVDPNDPAKLKRLRFFDESGETKEISPVQFAKLRQIIAAQNGVKIESDKANPDIVRAGKIMHSAGNVALDANAEDWISAISALSGSSEEEIDEWPILKFQRRSESYQRILSYVICGIGECSGTTWKDGNPTPHPFFARLKNGNGVLSEMGGSADGTSPAPPEPAKELRDITPNLS